MEIYEKAIYKIVRLINNKEFNQALLFCEHLFSQGVQTEEVIIFYAEILKNLKSIDEALKYLEGKYEELKNEQQSLILLISLARLNEELRNFSKSIFYYETILSNFDILDQRIVFNLALCYQQIKNYKSSIKYYKMCLEINENFEPAILNLSIVMLKTADQKSSLAILYQYNSKNEESINNNIFVIQNMLNSTLQIPKQVVIKIEESVNNIMLKINESVYYTKNLDYQNGLKILSQLNKKIKNNKKQKNPKFKYIVCLYMALCLYQLGRMKQALDYFKQVYLFPNSPHRKFAKDIIAKIRGNNGVASRTLTNFKVLASPTKRQNFIR